MNRIYKVETDLQNKLTVTKGKDGGSDREFGMDVYTLLYLKWITSKGLLYSTGNSAHCYVATWMEGAYVYG